MNYAVQIVWKAGITGQGEARMPRLHCMIDTGAVTVLAEYLDGATILTVVEILEGGTSDILRKAIPHFDDVIVGRPLLLPKEGIFAIKQIAPDV